MWDFKKCDELEAELEGRKPLTERFERHFVVYLYNYKCPHFELWLREETHIWGRYDDLEGLKTYLKKLQKADEVRIWNFI